MRLVIYCIWCNQSELKHETIRIDIVYRNIIEYFLKNKRGYREYSMFQMNRSNIAFLNLTLSGLLSGGLGVYPVST